MSNGIPRALTTPEGVERRIKTNDDAALDITGVRGTIDELHYYIHEGIAFSTQIRFALAGNGDFWLVWNMLDLTAHLTNAEYQMTLGGIDIDIHENVLSTGGTPVAVFNRNRDPLVKKDTEIEVVSNPTVTDSGTLIDRAWFPPASAPQGRIAMTGRDSNEWVFDRAIDYGIHVVNQTNDAKTVQMKFTWHEIEQLTNGINGG